MDKLTFEQAHPGAAESIAKRGYLTRLYEKYYDGKLQEIWEKDEHDEWQLIWTKGDGDKTPETLQKLEKAQQEVRELREKLREYLLANGIDPESEEYAECLQDDSEED